MRRRSCRTPLVVSVHDEPRCTVDRRAGRRDLPARRTDHRRAGRPAAVDRRVRPPRGPGRPGHAVVRLAVLAHRAVARHRLRPGPRRPAPARPPEAHRRLRRRAAVLLQGPGDHPRRRPGRRRRLGSPWPAPAPPPSSTTRPARPWDVPRPRLRSGGGRATAAHRPGRTSSCSAAATTPSSTPRASGSTSTPTGGSTSTPAPAPPSRTPPRPRPTQDPCSAATAFPRKRCPPTTPTLASTSATPSPSS